nr:transposase [Paenibacillus sp. HWE-109]
MTNLSAADFPPDKLESIYNMRWGIETSFRALKYTVGLTSFHAKKQEFIIQEIFARMIMYNFAEMMTSHVVISQMDKRHHYQVDFTVAVHVCRHFLRSKDNEPPPDVEALIHKNILPIQPIHPGQQKARKILADIPSVCLLCAFFLVCIKKQTAQGFFPCRFRIHLYSVFCL